MTRAVYPAAVPSSHVVNPAVNMPMRYSSTTKPLQPAVSYAQPFCSFLSENPTVFHAVSYFATELEHAGYTKLSERSAWDLSPGGRYYLTRNSSSLIAFQVGKSFRPGDGGVAMIAGHVDALTAKLKPISKIVSPAGFSQLGVAPYAGALGPTWWDRDLGIAGRVYIKEGAKVVEKLVDLHEPIARIPTLAPHFGSIASGPFNLETQMVPVIGLEADEGSFSVEGKEAFVAQDAARTFAEKQPPRLVKAIQKELGVKEAGDIVNWELELYDVQPATVGGLDKEFIYGGRIDDKLCSWSALEGLLASGPETSPSSVKLVGLFDDEEIGSLLRQGAQSNFLPGTVERIVDSLSSHKSGANLLAQTYANSFLVSADVTHAVNPNFLNAYLTKHAPRLNVGVTVSADASG